MNSEAFLRAYGESRNGTDNFHVNRLYPRFLYSDGVRECADAGCYWLLDILGTEITAQDFARRESGMCVVRVFVAAGRADILGEFRDGDPAVEVSWARAKAFVWNAARSAYQNALLNGIAKEQARALLPEGLTPSRLYMNGTMRSWIFYLKQRLHPSTQKEHRELAQQVLMVLRTAAPVTTGAFFPEAPHA